jgi:hypothetical protein
MSRIRQFVVVMKSLYEDNDYPSERLIREQVALAGFTAEFNSRVNGHFASEDVAAELERIRKDKKGSGGLPRLGRSYQGPHFVLQHN